MASQPQKSKDRDEIEEIDGELNLEVKHRVKSTPSANDAEHTKWPEPGEVLTGLPGISDISAVPAIGAKIFWTVFVFFAICMTGYQLYEVIDYYITSPVTISQTYVDQKPMRFPWFEICPLVPVNYTYIATEKIPLDYVRWVLGGQLSNEIPDSVITAFYMSEARQIAADKIYQDLRKKGKSWTQQVADLSFRCENFMLSCKLNGIPFDCCEKHTVTFKSAGACFAWKTLGSTLETNTKPEDMLNLTTTKVGPANGLEMVFDLQAEITVNNLKAFGNKGYESPAYQLGMAISFAEPSMIDLREFWAYAPPEKQTYVALYYKTRKGVPGRTCKEDRYLKYLNTRWDRNFQRMACDTECFWNATMNMCGCGPVSTIPNQPDNCELKKAYDCIVPYLYTAKAIQVLPQFGMSFLNHSINCNVDCTISCQKQNWAPRVTYADMLQKPELTAGRKLTKVLAYFPTSTMTYIVEKSNLSWTSMVGQIGGVFGLWLGASVSSIVQVCFYALVKGATVCCGKIKGH